MATAHATDIVEVPKDVKYERIVLEPSPDMEKEIETAKGKECFLSVCPRSSDSF